MDTAMLIMVVSALLLVNAVALVLVLLQLPGTWLMLLATSAVALWYRDDPLISWQALLAMLCLALVGELIEFLAGAWGARKYGASRRAAVGAVVGGIVGAVFGSIFIPVPVIGTLAGAALGAGLGSIVGDLWAGRKWEPAFKGGQGAALGRLGGAAGKFVVAVAMYALVVAAVLWP